MTVVTGEQATPSSDIFEFCYMCWVKKSFITGLEGHNLKPCKCLGLSYGFWEEHSHIQNPVLFCMFTLANHFFGVSPNFRQKHVHVATYEAQDAWFGPLCGLGWASCHFDFQRHGEKVMWVSDFQGWNIFLMRCLEVYVEPICSMYGLFTNICPKNHPVL